MNRIVLSLAAVAAFCMPALAADLPAKAPVVAPTFPMLSGLSASGFYVGAFAGGAMTRESFDFVTTPGTGSLHPSGLLAGVKVGHAAWYGGVLIGIEADGAYNFRDQGVTCEVALTCKTDKSYLLTQRLILGWALGGAVRAAGGTPDQWPVRLALPAGLSTAQIVPYVTAGVAERYVRASVSGFGDGSRWLVGPVGGAGIRVPLSSGLTLDLSYLYAYYHKDFVPVDSAPIFAPVFKAQSEHIMRVGLNAGF